MPKWIDYSFCYTVNANLSKDNWYKDENDRMVVLKEVNGIVFYAKNLYINDIEI